MFNSNKLKAKMVECGKSVDVVSSTLHISKTTFYRKISKNTFTIKEIEIFVDTLSLSRDEAVDIFFALNRADMH